MHTGMLWLDTDPKRTLEQKIKRAVDYYLKKYQRVPELCLVHPSMLKGQDLKEWNGMTVRAWRPVLPGHLWIGIEDATDLSQPKAEREHDLD